MKPILLSLLLFTSLTARGQSVELTIQTDKTVYKPGEIVKLSYRVENKTKRKMKFICTKPRIENTLEWNVHMTVNDCFALMDALFINAGPRPHCKIKPGAAYKDSIIVRPADLYRALLDDADKEACAGKDKFLGAYRISLSYHRSRYGTVKHKNNQVDSLRSNEINIVYSE